MKVNEIVKAVRRSRKIKKINANRVIIHVVGLVDLIIKFRSHSLFFSTTPILTLMTTNGPVWEEIQQIVKEFNQRYNTNLQVHRVKETGSVHLTLKIPLTGPYQFGSELVDIEYVVEKISKVIRKIMRSHLKVIGFIKNDLL